MRKKSFLTNISWIFVGNLAHAVLSFLINILVARLLTKSDYGIINYAASWISFFNVIASLGLNSVINKYLTEDEQQSGAFLYSAVFARAAASVFAVLSITGLILFLEKGHEQIIAVTVVQSLSVLFSVGDTFVYWFRYKNEADSVAVMRLVAFGLSALVKLVAILVYNNVVLYAIGVVCESLFFSLLLLVRYRKKYNGRIEVSKNKIGIMLKSSYPFIFSGVLVIIYAQTDKIMLQRMCNSEVVASYSVAVSIAGIVSVIAGAIIEGFRPELFSLSQKDRTKYFRRLRQAYCVIFWLCIFYGTIITLFSEQILMILYGSKYLSAAPALSLVVWYTSFSYFGSINNVYMVIENKEKWVQINTLVGAICNVCLNFILIPHLNIIGAALASLLTQFISNFIMIFLIKDLRPLAMQIVKAILLVDTFELKNIKSR